MKKKRGLLWLCMIIPMIPAIALAKTSGKIDSLEAILKSYTATDTVRVQHLVDLALELQSINPERTISLGKEALDLSRKLDYTSGEALANNRIGLGLRSLGKYDSSLYYFQIAKSIREKQHNKKGLASVYLNIGLVYATIGEYDSAAINYRTALKYAEEVSDNAVIGTTLNNLGFIYRSQKNIDEAVKYFDRALELYKNLNSKRGIAYAYQNLGICADQQANYSQSSKYFHDALDLYDEIGDVKGTADCNLNMGISLMNQKEYGRALDFIKIALQQHQKLGDLASFANDLSSLASLYAEQDQWSDAIQTCQQSLTVAKKIGDKKTELNDYVKLNDWYGETGDFKSAYEYGKKASKLNDSLFNENQTKIINDLKTQYETEKKDQQIKLLNKDMELQSAVISRQRILRDALIAIAALILLAGALYLNRVRLIQRQRTLAEHKRISGELHDDIGATLSSFSITSEVIKNEISRGQHQEAMESVEIIGNESRELMDRLSDIVWAINPRNDSFDKLILRLQNYAQRMCAGKNIDLQFEVDESLKKVELPMEIRNNYFLIAKEAVNNAVKYSGCSQLIIHLRKKGQSIVADISDDGKGFDVDGSQEGNGLRNMRQRAEDIHAFFKLASSPGNGTQLTMSLDS